MAQSGTGSTQEGGKPSQYECKIIDWDVLHARIQEFCQGGSRPDCQKTALTTFFFFLVLNLFYTFTVVFKENHKFPRFQRESNIFQGGVVQHFPGGPTFSRGGGV